MPLHPQAQEIASKILYEQQMFDWSYAGIIYHQCRDDMPSDHPDRLVCNTLLECFLLHARNLYDFFISEPQRDDVSALQFFDDPATWNTLKPHLCPYLRSERQRLQGMLAHVTYRRLTYEEQGQKSW